MNLHNVNSYVNLGIEYELPFYIRAMGCNGEVPVNDFMQGNSRHYLAVIRSGKCKLQLGSKTVNLYRGDGFFVRAHFPFRYEGIEGKCAVHWLVFDGYATIPTFAKFEYENYMIFHDLDIDALTIQFSNLYLTSLKEDKVSKLKNSAALYQLLVDVYEQEQRGSDSEKQTYSNSSFLRGKRCIDQYYYKASLTQAEIADAAGITTQYLCRLFRENLHQTPMQYLNSVRIERAKHLLMSTDDLVQTIGEKVGFATPHYFSLTFRKMTGNSPSMYRKLCRIGMNA